MCQQSYYVIMLFWNAVGYEYIEILAMNCKQQLIDAGGP